MGPVALRPAGKRDAMSDVQLQAAVLNQALPYIQAFRGQTFVIKYGGSAMQDEETVRGVIRNVLLLQLIGIKPVLVHGGGKEIDRWLGRLGMKSETREGLRATDEATMEVVEMALAGRANKAIVAEIQRNGGEAIGLSGRDGGILSGAAISAELGRVGRVTAVNPRAIHVASEAGFVPVVCSVAGDSEARALNINADSAAGAISGAVGAAKLIILTDTDGVLRDVKDAGSRISRLRADEARAMLASGSASSGMIPKLEAAICALEAGVKSVHILNGGTPNAILIEVLTDEGIGTMLS